MDNDFRKKFWEEKVTKLKEHFLMSARLEVILSLTKLKA